MEKAYTEDLKKIPYIDNIPLDDREVGLYPYFDETKKDFVWPRTHDGKLTWILGEPCESLYCAKSKFNETNDIYLDFNNVLIQNFSYPNITYYFNAIINDILNCSAFFEKYFILHDLYLTSDNLFISSLIRTEIECFFGNIRSIYDLLQKTIKNLWYIETKENLPSSFADAVKQTNDDLRSKYNLNKSLINYYNLKKDFFLKCRKIRDDIHHSGQTVNFIFCDEDGFAIQNNDPMFSPFVDVWPIEKVKENGLASILALVSFVTKQTIKDLNDFSSVIVESLTRRPPISNNYKVFLRGPYINHLNKLDKYLEEQWYVPAKS